eukprot:CAMPEP_0181492686 /NCGR_PEP_ID=MMETSP1110-20121109/50820_1 /TAXON_ID=174948 /ORGANISM="Symbiodinium sp., Strain CCMP421" /LENGTH=89 /DNA_ID=CAMNT_0023619947 /DNA_START=85 /DNA_END=350 /DNA_ORIENTATION=+
MFTVQQHPGSFLLMFRRARFTIARFRSPHDISLSHWGNDTVTRFPASSWGRCVSTSSITCHTVLDRSACTASSSGSSAEGLWGFFQLLR